MTDLKVNIRKIINAPIATVFDAWINPDILAKFMLPMPGTENSQVENDPRVGGEFVIMMKVGDDRVPHTGKYLQIDRPNQLAFTWESPASLDDSVVTLIFTKLGNHQTNVELTHVKFIDKERRSNHEQGWGNILDELGNMIG